MDLIFDTHAHYDDEAFDEDRELLLKDLPGQGIGRVVNIGASMKSSRESIALAERYEMIYCAVGVHPTETGELTPEDIALLKEMAVHPKCVAVGEIGLDYYWQSPAHDVQKKWFVRQLELARELNKPVVIHSREACKDTLDIMKAQEPGEIKGVVHCYSYSRETAREYLDMGFYFGIGGVLTFKNSRVLKEVVQYLPLDRIVLETDCPYLAPVPLRGKRNSSLNLPYVVEELACIKGVTPREIRRITWENGCKLYGTEG